MSTRVYLGHLSRDASDKDVEDLFRKYGRIREVTIKNGFGFIEFGDARDAKDAVYDIHGKSFMGERLVVELARGERRREDRRDDRFGPPERTEHRLIVENLAHGVSWQDIKDLMRKAGEVTFADLSKDFDDQGVVEFATEDDMRYALKSLDGKELRGKPITLRLFDSSKDTAPRDVGRGGGGGGRDRDHGRDRGRRDRDFDRDRRDRRRSRSRSPRGRRASSRDRSRDRRRSRSRDHGGSSRVDRDRERRGSGRHSRSRSRSRD